MPVSRLREEKGGPRRKQQLFVLRKVLSLGQGISGEGRRRRRKKEEEEEEEGL